MWAIENTNGISDPNSKDMGHSLTLVGTLFPLLRVMAALGLSPISVDRSTQTASVIKLFSQKSFQLLANMIIMTIYFGISLFQGIFLVKANQKLVLADYVTIFMPVYSTLVPLGIILLLLKKRSEFANYLNSSKNYKLKLIGIVDCQYAYRILRRNVIFYGIAGILTIIIMAIQAWKSPLAIGVNVKGLIGENLGIIFTVLLHSYITGLNFFSSSFIEIMCCTLGSSTVRCMENVKKMILDRLTQEENLREIDSNFISIMSQYPEKSSPKMDAFMSAVKMDTKQQKNNAEKTCVCTIMECLRKIQIIGTAQRILNNIFGPIIVLSTGLTVFLTCTMVYLYIKTSMFVFAEHEKIEADQNLMLNAYLQYWGRFIIVIIQFSRLSFTFITLGNIHDASVNLYIYISQSLLKIGDTKGRSSDLHTILGYLTMSSLNPICFSAGGYFSFSRATILATASIIATYVIFLLQS